MRELSASEKLELLSRLSLFSGLEQKELEALVPVTRTQTLRKRQELFHKGDEGSEIYAIVNGRLKVYTTSGTGDDVAFNIMGPGEVFGEIALLGRTPRTATISALEACQLLVIGRKDFIAFLRRNPEASVRLLEVLAVRMKKLSELVEDTLFLNLPLRLAKKFNALARIHGSETEDGIRVDLKLSQEEWGDLIGATRESVNKQLRTWTEEGLVSVDRGYIVIRRPRELEKLAQTVL